MFDAPLKSCVDKAGKVLSSGAIAGKAGMP
jgi:hypothetical protein